MGPDSSCSSHHMSGPPCDLPVAIIGAGLTGAMCALMLAKRGYSVIVIEKRGDPRAERDEEASTA